MLSFRNKSWNCISVWCPFSQPWFSLFFCFVLAAYQIMGRFNKIPENMGSLTRKTILHLVTSIQCYNNRSTITPDNRIQLIRKVWCWWFWLWLWQMPPSRDMAARSHVGNVRWWDKNDHEHRSNTRRKRTNKNTHHMWNCSHQSHNESSTHTHTSKQSVTILS